MTGPFQARIIGTGEELAALEPEWWALWRRIPSATPFQSPAWLLPWWQCFAPGELHAVAVHREDRLAALVPFYLEIGAQGHRLLPIGISVSDYLDVLIEPGDADAAAQVLIAALMSGGAWRSWEMPELGPHAQAAVLLCPPGCEDALEQGETCPFLMLPARVEDLRCAFPPRKRRALAMNRNRAERRGALRFQALEDSPPATLLAELIRLHGLRWESRQEPGVLGDPRVQAFHGKALPRLAAAGLARLYGLRIGKDMAAVYYGFVHNGHAYAYLTGIDPAFAHESPGTLLLAYAMEQAIRDGACEFHFLRGGEAYKYGWGAVDRWNRRRVISRRHTDAAA